MSNACSWMVRTLVEWVQKNARSFEWDAAFENPDPYRILVAEIMLQRTNANAAQQVYREFIDRFPTLASLDQAAVEEIVCIFTKLGLPARAKRIPGMFRQLFDEYHGQVPDTFSKLTSLSGVGPYVANAVLCFAFGRKMVPVDVNVVRVVSRFFRLDYVNKKEFQTFVDGLLDHTDDPRPFALSLMELGAQVCKAKVPKCEYCPLVAMCKTPSLYWSMLFDMVN